MAASRLASTRSDLGVLHPPINLSWSLFPSPSSLAPQPVGLSQAAVMR